MCKKIFIAALLAVVLIAAIVAGVGKDSIYFDCAIAIFRFFDLILPIFAVCALAKYLCSGCSTVKRCCGTQSTDDRPQVCSETCAKHQQ